MARNLNATDLFGPKSGTTLISCSESFWTTLFALFLLEQTRRSESHFSIPVYVRSVSARAAPWYERRRPVPDFAPGNLQSSDLAVEPPTLEARRFLEGINGGSSLPAFGIRPDVLVRGKEEHPCLTFIECKISTALQENQMENYPIVIGDLRRKGQNCQLLLIASIGMPNELDSQVKRLQERLDTSFGVLLWEEVIRGMIQSRFVSTCFGVQGWEKYTEALKEEVQAD